MTPAGGLVRRLDALRRSAQSPSPLWIEFMPPAEALIELQGHEGPLAHLQRARLLRTAGQTAAATAQLEALPANLPQGLAVCRDELRTELSALVTAPFAVPTGCTRDRFSTSAKGVAHDRTGVVSLRQWLTRTQAWREVLGV